MYITELSKTLNQHFNFHKAHANCVAQIIRAVIAVKTVNFTHLATAFITKAVPESCYKRIQRFFRFLKFDPAAIASMVITTLLD